MSLVYTALKLCIDIDPTLFDECANEYKNQRQLERKHQKEREDNWKQLQQKVEKLTMKETAEPECNNEVPAPHVMHDYLLEDVDILESDSPVEQTTTEQKDDIHPVMQQFDTQPTQYQFFRRKSIIPVDETVFNELSRHVSLDEVLNGAPGAGSTHNTNL